MKLWNLGVGLYKGRMELKKLPFFRQKLLKAILRTRRKWAGPKGMDNLFPLKFLSHFDPLLNQKTEKKLN